MLEELQVRNYALIENLTLSFERGFNVITGETGAGKSIIVGALSFLLGAKSSADYIRTGAEEAGVSAVILIPKPAEEARSWLAARDISLEDERLIVRRSLKTSGRGSIFIQNIPVTRGELADFMVFLFDIHGQHQHESLLRRETHRIYLDRFAGIEGEAASFNKNFISLSEKRKMIEAALQSTREREAKIELLSYAVEEIEKAALKGGESRELEAEAARLASFEKLVSGIDGLSRALFEGEMSVLSLSRKARAAIENASALDTSLSPLEQRLSALYFEADDIAQEIRVYRDKLSFDPARQEAVEERLALIYKLKKKYAPKRPASSISQTEGGALFEEGEKVFNSIEDEIESYKNEAQAEIEALSVSASTLDKLKTEVSALEKELALSARSLTAKRKAASLELSQKISAALRRLGMEAARFSVQIRDRNEAALLRESGASGAGGGAGTGGAGGASGERAGGGVNENRILLGPYGADEIDFLISANTGESEKELAKIASGGELSRVMLAIKTALSGGPDALIFDEIDTGIGGEVAHAVGGELSAISKKKQVFCVTHLASIACRADNHIMVEKSSDGSRTITTVRNLDGGGRRLEIARLLSGDRGEAALAHADEMLEKYGRF